MIRTIRGVHDKSGIQAQQFEYILSQAKKVANSQGFEDLQVPTIESTDLYLRNLGEESDIVSKEIYAFEDKGGEAVALRPEFTAAIARFFVNNGKHLQQMPQKYFSYGQLFRYDRPQKGRYREFNQVNFEIFGEEDCKLDTFAIQVAKNFLDSLNLQQNTDYNLKINFLADEKTRESYKIELIKYFSNHKNNLSQDSARRLEKNPFRILDSNDEKDMQLIQNAPKISNFYSEEYKQYIQKTKDILTKLNINFEQDETLVRGMDYYDGIVFEFATNIENRQNAILGGGRYSRLVKELSKGKINVSSIGFAAGIERIMTLEKIKQTFNRVNIGIAPENDEIFPEALKLQQKITPYRVNISMNKGNISKKIKQLEKLGCNFIIVYGQNEIKTKTLKIKTFIEEIKHAEGKNEFEVQEDKIKDFFDKISTQYPIFD